MLRERSGEFLQNGLVMMRHYHQTNNESSSTDMQRFQAMFGTSPAICSLLWDMLDHTNTMPYGVNGFHLHWGLIFLKLYASVAVHCAISGGVDEKTFHRSEERRVGKEC